MITNKKIGVLAGGVSSEREVSLRSGNAVYKVLSESGYNVVFIDTKANLYESLIKNNIELAFISLHGGYGENGAIQGFLEFIGIPYTGSGIMASALAMDKEASKKIFQYHKIPTSMFKVFEQNNLDLSQIDFPLPYIVKPTMEGSSIGVSIVKTKKEINNAIHSAFKYGKKIIIEKYIEGKEIQIAVLGQKTLGGVEIRPSKEFYDYEAKYTTGLTLYILPPQVDKEIYNTLKINALKAHQALGCKGATRVDFILDKNNIPYILEVNTIPGMTEISLLPQIAQEAGLNFLSLTEEMIKSALEE